MSQKFRGRERKLPLGSVVSAAFAKAQIVHLGDTDHKNNKRLNRWLSRPETLRELARQGVKAIYVETPRNEQTLYDALAFNLISEKEFIRFSGNSVIFRSKAETLAEDIRLVTNAADAGIRVICADPGNGMPALRRFHKTMNKIAGRSHPVETYLATDLMTRIFHRKIDRARKIRDPKKSDAALTRINAEFNKVAGQLGQFNRYRNDDRRLARFMADTLPADGKALLVYGAAHGRPGKNGLRTRLAEHEVSLLKIDVFPTRRSLTSHFNDYAAGRMQAEAVYVMNQGVYRATDAMPAKVTRRLG